MIILFEPEYIPVPILIGPADAFVPILIGASLLDVSGGDPCEVPIPEFIVIPPFPVEFKSMASLLVPLEVIITLLSPSPLVPNVRDPLEFVTR